ncbi:SET domain-containing protein-lysine N-methyltransferase [Candidatus Pacearchaeota archaeon CG10_big_fil_rev_8_21_14_0_10_31_9]|nr:MAG: SET domain-containing protein-lysine N-methyltransferase [Candidatus Pacearchaeota archaeon CG10_big_fil_rev_8_21_14_0_10_31_9]PIZ82664.1 MAG: SET domain-containing protein-lysine N-methyltransferase [Candidatus Pacearchaeota archaeon CG_4_10_14_0_2_um_filter_05_32_18]
MKVTKIKDNKKTEENEWIKFKTSKIHSTGGFAIKDIPKKTKIIEYVGKKVTKKEAEKIADREMAKHKRDKNKGAVYLFELNKTNDIDGNVPWNHARFINHSCSPNAEFDIKGGKVWIVAIKNIKKGEEITYDYGYDLENWHEHPCKCGSENCIGYIVARDEWHKLSKRLKKG